MYSTQKYSVYTLYKYGISIDVLKNLHSLDTSVEEIVLGEGECLKEFFSSDVVDAANRLLYEKNKSFCAIELFFYGLPISICEKLILKNLDITRIKANDGKVFKNNIFSKEDICKIYKSLKKRELCCNYSYYKPLFFYVDYDDFISVEKLVSLLVSEFGCLEHDIKAKIDQLKTNDVCMIDERGVRLIKESVVEFVENKLDAKDRYIIKSRACGKTLEEIGQFFNITRERVRQKEKRVITKMFCFTEDSYAEIFEKYNFTSDLFCLLFDEDEVVYFYLEKKYNLGTTKPSKLLDSNLLNDLQKEKLMKYIGMIKLGDKVVIASKNEFVRYIIFKYAKDPINIEEFYEFYNKKTLEIKDYDFYESNDRALEGKVARFDFTIQGFKKSFRYYDKSLLSKSVINKIKKIIDGLEPGVYSTLYVFNNNIKLMKQIDVRDEYELHNLMKKFIFANSDIVFERMPNIHINCDDRRAFFERIILDNAPTTLENITNILFEKYGHKKSSMLTYLVKEFPEYVFGNDVLLLSEDFRICNKSVEILKKSLDQDIYLISDYVKIANDLIEENVEKYLNTYNFNLIGFNKYNMYIVKDKFETMVDYFEYLIEKKDYIDFYNPKIYDLQTVQVNIYVHESKLNLLRVSKTRYLTRKGFKKKGWDIQVLQKLRDQIALRFSDVEYFSLANVLDSIDMSEVANYGLGKVSQESLIRTIQDVRTVRVADHRFFTFNKSAANFSCFLETLVAKFNVISPFMLRNYIHDKFGVEIDEFTLKSKVKLSSLYYDSKNDKIYVSKDEFKKSGLQNNN